MIARAIDTEPAVAASVAFVPRLCPSARRTLRLRPTFTAPAPALVAPRPSRTGALPLCGRPSFEATREETVSDALREHTPSHELSVVSRPAVASAIDSSIAMTAKAGGETAAPPTVKLTGVLAPLFPAASLWRAATV